MLSSLTVLHPGYADFIAGGHIRPHLINDCVRDMLREPGGLGALARSDSVEGQCGGTGDSGDRTSQGILVSYGVLAVATTLHYLFRSARRARRPGIQPLDPTRRPALYAETARLASGVDRARGVVFLIDFLDSGVNGVTFGRAGRRQIVLSRGLLRLLDGNAADRAAFRAVVLHELAHLRNRDVDITLVTLGLLRCYFVLMLFPRMLGDLVNVLLVSEAAPYSGLLLPGSAATGAVLLIARSVILRTREYGADARVVGWMGTAQPLLHAFDLASAASGGRPGRSVRGWWAKVTRTHPTFDQRRACLADRTLMMHQGFGFAFVIGYCLPTAWDPVSSVTARIRQGGGVSDWWPARLITLVLVLVLLLTVARSSLHGLRPRAEQWWERQPAGERRGRWTGRRTGRPSPVPFRLGLGLGVLTGVTLAPSAVIDRMMMQGLRISSQASGWLTVALLALLFTVWCQYLGDSWARAVDLTRRPVITLTLVGLVVAVAVVVEARTVFDLQWQIEFGQFMDARLAALPGPLHTAVWAQFVYMSQLVSPLWLPSVLAMLLGVPLVGAACGRRLARGAAARERRGPPVPPVPPVRPARRLLVPVLAVAALTAYLLPPTYMWWAHQLGLDSLAHPLFVAPITEAAIAGTLVGGLARRRGTVWAVLVSTAVGLWLCRSLPTSLWSLQVGIGIEGAVLGSLLMTAIPRRRRPVSRPTAPVGPPPYPPGPHPPSPWPPPSGPYPPGPNPSAPWPPDGRGAPPRDPTA
ncbi:M48 family metalloprotease [Kitasatospora sp. NPDC005856]|uniref:M48 family metalloprotease n=1 Tax=Kitasatospora sp. NPDC005856 TaxID=3154566 RepID=UPI003402A275